MNQKKFNILFYCIILSGLALRIYIVFFSSLGWKGCDTDFYLAMANGIISGNPISHFPNGYPLVLSAILYLGGEHVNIIAVMINIIVQILSLIIVKKILIAYSISQTTILLTILVFALYPNQVSSVRFIMSEPISMFLILFCIYLFVKKNYLVSGILGFLTFSFRPSLLLATPLMILYALKNQNYYSAFKNAVGFLIGLGLFLILSSVGITKNPSTQNYNTLVAIQSYGYDIQWNIDNFNEQEKQSPFTTYLNFAVQNPVKFLQQRFLSLYSLWGPVVDTEYGFIGRVLHGLRFPLFMIAVLVVLYRNKIQYDKNLIVLLSIPVISLTFIQMLYFSQQRHQIAVEPFVITLSILGIMGLKSVERIKN